MLVNFKDMRDYVLKSKAQGIEPTWTGLDSYLKLEEGYTTLLREKGITNENQN